MCTCSCSSVYKTGPGKLLAQYYYVMITQLGVKPQHSLAKRLVSKVAVVVVQCHASVSTVEVQCYLALRQVLITPWPLSCT